MIKVSDNRLTRIGVFYDGNYFLHVSNYYNYEHPRNARLSLGGLHRYIRHHIAQKEETRPELCSVVEGHYFRGRLNAYEAREADKLFTDRLFDDILMNEGVITHYLPLRSVQGRREEKGIDVWLALEVLEQAVYKSFNVVALVACDGDYLPLIRKLNAMGTRVLLLSWDFTYTDREGRLRETRTSQDLLEEVNYPLTMHHIIDRAQEGDELIDKLFVSSEPAATNVRPVVPEQINGNTNQNQRQVSTIISLKSGFGFISHPPNNIFFHYSELLHDDFNDLKEGDTVQFSIDYNERGQECAVGVAKIPEEEGRRILGDQLYDGGA